jgi:predicted kinase
MIVIVFGLPGSGKSFFASRLTSWLGADYITSDKIRKMMFSSRTYSINEKLSVYDEMLSAIKKAARENKNVVADATFYKDEIRKKFISEIKDFAKTIWIEVQAEESLIKERMKHSRVDSEADFEVYETIKKQWEPMQEHHLILQSTNDNLEEILNIAKDHLRLNDDQRTDRKNNPGS